MVSATQIIQLTRDQVYGAMQSVVDDLQRQYPNEEEAENKAYELSSDLYERILLQRNIVPRIEGCRDLEWLKDNDVQFTIKSSRRQFVEERILRVQILKEAQRKAWVKWRDS